ncbi:hypothetical protein N0V84_002515 [Fusarium piperis]|uniref:Uncharacterized protein n=1 Tax=Fusarium piperis TaxID=1435070 RepID=A0A9W9BRK5_9HYPO|nr:hypothetical protein N0V84_002515 [Fusarium piperis]
MEYVYAVKGRRNKPIDWDSDDMKPFELKGIRHNQLVGQGIIFLEGYLVPGSLASVKKALWGKVDDDSGRSLDEHITLWKGTGPHGPFDISSVVFRKYRRDYEYSEIPYINWPQ